MVRAISLGPCRRPIEYLTSSHPCGRLSKIPNSQIHKVKKWKILSNFRRKDFFVISHERKDRFFVVIWPKKTLRHIKYRPKIDLFFPKNQNFAPKHKILKNQWEKFSRFHYCQISKFWFFKSALLLSNQFWANILYVQEVFWAKSPVLYTVGQYIGHILEHDFFCLGHLGCAGSKGKKVDLRNSEQLLRVVFSTFWGQKKILKNF